MIKVFKSHVCLCALTTSVFFFIPNINAGAQDSKPSCSSLFKSYPCDALGKVKSISESLSNVTYASSNTGVKIINKGIVKVGEKENLGVYGTLRLKKTGEIASEVLAQENMEIFFEDGSVTGSSKKIGSRNNDIKRSVFGVKQGGTLLVLNGKVDVTDVHGLIMESSTGVFIPGGQSFYGILDGKPLYGSWDQRYSKVVFENSDIIVKGRGARGMYFQGGPSQEDYEEGEALVQLGELEFKKTAFQVPDGTAIYIDDAKRFPYIMASEGARIFADRLLEVKNHSYVVVEADASFLVGGTRIDKNSYAEIELSNKSKWTLTPGKNNKWRDSSVSFVRNIDSSVFFQKPKNGRYQTLRIGTDNLVSDYAYVAKNARLIINASLTTDGKNKGIKADKVLIYGDVYGNTKVHVVEVPADSRKGKSLSQDDKRSNHSVSVIQVYGEASEDSFKLASGYVALRGAPYRYRLRAYGPTSSLGNAKNENMLAKQKSSKSNGGFWDFRLETEYVQSSSQLRKNSSRSRVSRSIGSSADRNHVVADAGDFIFYPSTGIKAVVPQVPTYLLLPNALFHAGLIDISNQNKQLEESRAAVGGFLENSENPAFFVRSYGGNSRYVSDLSDLEYGYGGDLGYHAVEAGVLLKAMKSADYSTSFGIMGTYGKISLQPQDVVESKKSAFNKWSLTAYGGVQHDTGFYLNGLFSYGLFTGDVLTLVRGKTAELKGNALSVSLSGGKSFMTGYEGLVFDPQVQVIYQNLQFDKASDIDGFDIDMGKPNQWVMRVGGRLSKTLAVSQTGGVVSFNGKLHFTHRFGEKQFVHFGDKFQLGAFGSSLEAGLGFNAQLSSMFSLHGDVTYQHKLSKAGFSGTRFSGGLRYRF